MDAFRPLANSDVISVDLDEEEFDNPGEAKSWGSKKSSQGRKDLKVDIEPLHQVHGELNALPFEKDNASLLVFKFLAKPKNDEHKVLMLKVELRLLMPNSEDTEYEEEDYDEDGYPEIIAAQPAGQGQQYADELFTDVTKQKGYKVSATVSPKVGSIATERSGGETRAFKEHDLLTITRELEKTDQSINKRNLVTWTVNAASTNKGIGDSLTVAVLIKRPSQSQFCLNFSSEGRLGNWVDKAMVALPFLKKKKQHPLGLYGPGRHDQNVPDGILVNNLNATMANRELLKKLKVGLHLPEYGAPVTYDQDEVPLSTTENMSAGEEHAAQVTVSGGGDADAGKPTSTSLPTSSATAPSKIDATGPVSDTRSSTEPRVTADTKGPAPRGIISGTGLQRDFQGQPAPTPPYIYQHKQKSFGTTAENTALRSQARRADRHRMIAALYERLAKLHREEAEELAQPDEVAYVNEVLKEEMDH